MLCPWGSTISQVTEPNFASSPFMAVFSLSLSFAVQLELCPDYGGALSVSVSFVPTSLRRRLRTVDSHLFRSGFLPGRPWLFGLRVSPPPRTMEYPRHAMLAEC